MGKGKPRKTEREKQRGTDIVILQKTVYISGHDREEGACVWPNSNILDNVHEDIITENPVVRDFNFDKKRWEMFPEYSFPGNCDVMSHCGWSGIRKLFPWIDRDMNVECRVTVMFNSKDVNWWNEEYEIEKYDPDYGLYSFHAEADFWYVSSDNGKYLYKGKENGLYIETRKGYIAWDCVDRGNGTVIDNDSPLSCLFPESGCKRFEYEDYNGTPTDEVVGIPHKIRIFVDADIDTDTKEI